MIEVLPADDTKRFREFLSFPFSLYKNDSRWVPPLIKDIKYQFSERNPFLKHAVVQPFVAKINGDIAGRITAIHNQGYVDFYNEKTGFFGFFDCVNENRVAKALFGKVKEWLSARGLILMRGPMNFSSNEEWGTLIEGFDDPPMIMMPYNFPYYDKLCEMSGLVKAKDLYAYIYNVPDNLPDKVHRVADIAVRRGIKVRTINRNSLRKEMRIFKDIYHSAWERNWGFMPMTDEEIDHTATQLKPLIVPDLALIAELNNQSVGFMMILPDFNSVLKRLHGRLLPFGIFKALWYGRQIKDGRLLLLGIKEGFRKRGVDSLLFIEGLKGLKEKGYRRIEFSWILEDNYPVQRIIETLHGRLYKKYRIYEGRIQST